MSRHHFRGAAVRLLVATFACVLVLSVPEPAAAREPASATVPTGFRDELLFGGLDQPSAVEFASDGRVFVAEKRGRILVFDSLADSTPTVFANLEGRVHNYWDRGLLGLALDPGFPSRPYVYVLYTYNHILGDPAPPPRWPSDPGNPSVDRCPSPPGPTTDGCVVSGRLSRLTASGNQVSGDERVLIEDWCQQFPSHSIGDLAFGPEGALYVSSGDGASFTTTDYGQRGGTLPDATNPVTPRNPCGDPPGGVGGAMSPPDAAGGALRSQHLRIRGQGRPIGLDGTILRVDPNTGAAWPTNALAGDADANARRIIAYGLRNPFRFAIRPGTDDVWLGDVGWGSWEEINEIPNPGGTPRNFGWPCYEGAHPSTAYMNLGLSLCSNLPAGQVTSPVIAWRHGASTVPGDGCGSGGSSISGLAFIRPNSGFPAAYHGGLAVADYSRRCIWVYQAGADGRPDPTRGSVLANLARPSGQVSGGAVQLKAAPDGSLVYADFDRGEVRRISYVGANRPPTAVFTATPEAGPVPLSVSFDASGSTDPDGDALTYSWDLDGNGTFGDATGVRVARTYTTAGSVTVGLRVTDPAGASSTAHRTISAGASAPAVTITEPSTSLRWRVGETVRFAASASDPADGTLPASAYSWTLTLVHCPSDCHTHPVTTFNGVASGSFSAPDHDYPSHLLLRVTVRNSAGVTATASREVHPATGVIEARSNPAGVALTLGGRIGAPPPPLTGIVGSSVVVSAPTSAFIGGVGYRFAGWSDGGAATHAVTVGAGTGVLTATYQPDPDIASGSVTRLAGPDRYATAAAISAATFGAGVPVAYVATGANFPDALAGAPPAALGGGPVLLVTQTGIPAPIRAELERLRPNRIVVLGSAGVVSDAVAADLRGFATSGSVTRLAGPDRYATAAAISAATFGAGVPVAYVATGANFPDALAGAPPAALGGGPVLLVTQTGIPAPIRAELERLRPNRIVVLGSAGVVSDAVAADLAGLATR